MKWFEKRPSLPVNDQTFYFSKTIWWIFGLLWDLGGSQVDSLETSILKLNRVPLSSTLAIKYMQYLSSVKFQFGNESYHEVN